MSTLFTKLKSKEAKGICILIMFIHHLFAFPDRLDNVFNTDYLVRLGQEFGIIVGLYVFISGYGLALKPLSLKDGTDRIVKLWLSFCFVFFIFIPIGFCLGVYKFELKEFFENFNKIIPNFFSCNLGIVLTSNNSPLSNSFSTTSQMRFAKRNDTSFCIIVYFSFLITILSNPKTSTAFTQTVLSAFLLTLNVAE